MSTPQIVIDTNVFVAALRSRRGASYKLLTLIDSGKFAANVSVPLVLEYKDAAKRLIDQIALTTRDMDHILDYICVVARHHAVFYLWRPFLKDLKDDMVLELAVSARCDFIVTYNQRDFEGVEQFGISVITLKEFLRKIGELP
jgi:putative PIN family toxin of toxin-antitoxin system